MSRELILAAALLVAAAGWIALVRLCHRRLAARRKRDAVEQSRPAWEVYMDVVTEMPLMHRTSVATSLTMSIQKVPRLATVFKASGRLARIAGGTDTSFDSATVLVAEMTLNPPGSLRHQMACARLNQLHGPHWRSIDSDLMVYIIASLIVYHVNLVNRLGARQLMPHEVDAIVAINTAMAHGLGLDAKAMPSTFAGWEQWYLDFESKWARPSEETTVAAAAGIRANLFILARKGWGHAKLAFYASLVEAARPRAETRQPPMIKVPFVARKAVQLIWWLRKPCMRYLVPPRTRWDGWIQLGACPPPGTKLASTMHGRARQGYEIESVGNAKPLPREELLGKFWARARYGDDGLPSSLAIKAETAAGEDMGGQAPRQAVSCPFMRLRSLAASTA